MILKLICGIPKNKLDVVNTNIRNMSGKYVFSGVLSGNNAQHNGTINIEANEKKITIESGPYKIVIYPDRTSENTVMSQKILFIPLFKKEHIPMFKYIFQKNFELNKINSDSKFYDEKTQTIHVNGIMYANNSDQKIDMIFTIANDTIKAIQIRDQKSQHTFTITNIRQVE